MFWIFKSRRRERNTCNLTWSARLKNGMQKTSDNISGKIVSLFVNNKIDADILVEVEEILIQADVGVSTSKAIMAKLIEENKESKLSASDVKAKLVMEISRVLLPYAVKLDIQKEKKPHVIIFNGVNGVGKTTTIGKIAKQLVDQDLKVMIAACDTFRAAANKQLEIWAQRSGATLIESEKENGDPASVAYKALSQARAEQYDVLLIDTAGRLQNRQDLMGELAKICRVLKKIDESAPHNSILVVDGTTGQNAKNQLKVFKEFADIDGIVITKLDGSARGGIVISLASEFATNIYYIGVGEQIEDLHDFSAEDFARSIIGG